MDFFFIDSNSLIKHSTKSLKVEDYFNVFKMATSQFLEKNGY